MRKVKISSSGFSNYIPSSLNFFSVEDPLVQILCDEQRGILYTRSQNGAVRVYDLGAKGLDAPRRCGRGKRYLATRWEGIVKWLLR